MIYREYPYVVFVHEYDRFRRGRLEHVHSHWRRLPNR